MIRTDVAIIGGGIVGLATAWQLTRGDHPLRVVILEKEAGIARHQSGHNSGVLHSGIYYRPGSLKAENCRAGKKSMETFCDDEDIPYERIGKVIVATAERELPALDELHRRGQANGVECERIDVARLAELEPHCRGVAALHVPEAGIVDYRHVCARLAERIRERDGQIALGTRVRRIREKPDGVRISSASAEAPEVSARVVVNCGGLHSDRIARLCGHRPSVRIVPFRGEYFSLTPAAAGLCRALIYPVPDPALPFLGVHFTRMIDGEVECGPNAVFALSREGYRKRDVNPWDLLGSLTDPGFLRLSLRYWKVGAGETWRSLSKDAFVRALQHLVPDVKAEHLHPAPAGVRAQAIDRAGKLVDDFVFEETEKSIHVLNAPSPAATASLNIGATIAEKVRGRLR